MELLQAFLVSAAFFAAAFLYSSVGHAGASAYLAVMALLGIAPESMKPAALLLNVIVASVATVQFGRSRFFSWPLLWPFLVTAVPAAFIGGRIELPSNSYKVLVGLVLVYAGMRLVVKNLRNAAPHANPRRPGLVLSLFTGTAIGILAGLTGTGGGIFLTPMLVLGNWAEPKQAAAISPAFILANSISGLAGLATHLGHLQLPESFWVWSGAVLAGGFLGAWCGIRRFDNRGLRVLLAIVLLIAGTKLIFRI